MINRVLIHANSIDWIFAVTKIAAVNVQLEMGWLERGIDPCPNQHPERACKGIISEPRDWFRSTLTSIWRTSHISSEGYCRAVIDVITRIHCIKLVIIISASDNHPEQLLGRRRHKSITSMCMLIDSVNGFFFWIAFTAFRQIMGQWLIYKGYCSFTYIKLIQSL